MGNVHTSSEFQTILQHPMKASTKTDPLHIVFVIEATSGGVGRHVIDLVRELNRRGFKLTLIFSTGRINLSFRDAVAEFQQNGVNCIPFEMSAGFGKKDLADALALRKTLNQLPRFDVIHAHSSKASGITRLAAKMSPFRTFKIIVTPHMFPTLAPYFGTKKKKLFSWIERSLAKKTSQIICVAEHERRHAIEIIGIPASKLTVIPNGVAQTPAGQRDALRQSIGASDETIVIGFVGRFSAQKDPISLVKALAELPSNTNFCAVLVGSGELEDDVRAEIASLNLQAKVHLPGPENGPEWMAAFDIFALTSTTEGFPYVLLEAQVNSLPIVSTMATGCDEIVTDGSDGFLVPVGSTDRIAARLSELIQDPELRKSMGVAAKASASRFTIPEMADRTIAVYESASSAEK